jgi:hypothetical protein
MLFELVGPNLLELVYGKKSTIIAIVVDNLQLKTTLINTLKLVNDKQKAVKQAANSLSMLLS